MRKLIAVMFVAMFCIAQPARAFMRMRYEDEQVVQRSEIIAIAHIKLKSIEYVAHPHKPDEGHSYEHHAILALDEVLKGKSDAKEIPIVIHYGLTPVEGGLWQHDGGMISTRGGIPKPLAVIEIMDSGNSAGTFMPLVPDASQPNVWFLRRLAGQYGQEPPKPDTKFGIVDPEDLQPIGLKAYFQCYLSDDPEKAVRARLQVQPEVAERATRYLTHLEIERVLRIDDPARRVERLIPYWLARYDWGFSWEVEKGIVDAGELAGPYLLGIYDKRPDRREDVVRIWGAVKYRGAAPKLISLLQQHDQFWASQTLEKGWWNHDVDNELNRERREIYGETYGAVLALRAIGDRSAIAVIRKTHARWKAINFENAQIVEACEAALKDWNVPTTQPDGL